jgi:hypothetical protein
LFLFCFFFSSGFSSFDLITLLYAVPPTIDSIYSALLGSPSLLFRPGCWLWFSTSLPFLFSLSLPYYYYYCYNIQQQRTKEKLSRDIFFSFFR